MNKLTSRPLAGFLQNPFGIHAKSIELDDQHLIFRGGLAQAIHLREISASPKVSKGWVGSTLQVSTGRDEARYLKGANHGEACSFAKAVQSAWVSFNLDQVKVEEDAIKTVLRAITDLEEPKQYPSACLLSRTLEEAKRINHSLLSNLTREAVGDAIYERIERIQTFEENVRTIRAEAIAKFEKRQLDDWAVFFDTIESNPLTPEQRLSIIADEDATLVLAGAGSGKTSVITAKAGYLLKSGIRQPEEILLLAFANDAAKEMSERIQEKCGESLEARTFHALAYDIIGSVEGSKPALAAHATDDKAFLALIRDILRDLVRTVTEVSQAIIGWFSYARLEDKSKWDFKKKHDYYTFIEKADLRTFQGEKVKSFEELTIANWLFKNGIEYEYEPDYEHKVSKGGYRDYCPDFRLTKSGVYIEHFGVRRKKQSDGTFRFTTAPFVDREEYLKDMEWKRAVHQEHNTILIETFSYEREGGYLLDALAEKLAPHEELSPRPVEVLFDRIVELNQVDSFVQLIGTFLKHFKGGGYQISECAAKGEKLKLGKRAKAFLSIFEPVYAEYQKSLDGRIDFEDMILRASKNAESGKYRSPFKHILVDEFQDISRSRGRLVKALQAQHEDARLFAVGDDWQSIYRFAGSDINLMGNFGDEFGGTFDGETGVHRVVDLGRTFRSVDQIAYAAKKFVMQNPAQLQKRVVPAGIADTPAIKVVPTFRHDADQKLAGVLRALPVNPENKKRTTALLLGRYGHLAPDRLPQLRQKFPHLDISFKTIHSSKGLEADHVIVLGLFRGRTGFPSEIVDDPLLSLVSPDAEPFENAEERRVMYVALTRARKTITLMSSVSKQSAFVSELLDDSDYGVVNLEEEQQQSHTCGECGGNLIAVPKKDGRMWYRCEHTTLCGFSINPCQSCGIDLPVQEGGTGPKKCTNCGAEYPACPECENGWLVERRGRFGPFLGCVCYPRCHGKMKLNSNNLNQFSESLAK